MNYWFFVCLKYMTQHRGELPTPIKKMRQIRIECSPDSMDFDGKQTIKISLLCNRFLYKMARSIVGALVNVGFQLK